MERRSRCATMRRHRGAQSHDWVARDLPCAVAASARAGRCGRRSSPPGRHCARSGWRSRGRRSGWRPGRSPCAGRRGSAQLRSASSATVTACAQASPLRRRVPGGHERRGELLARGHHVAHVVAPQAAVAAAQGDLGHGLLAARRTGRGPPGRRWCSGTANRRRAAAIPATARESRPASWRLLAPLRRPHAPARKRTRRSAWRTGEGGGSMAAFARARTRGCACRAGSRHEGGGGKVCAR